MSRWTQRLLWPATISALLLLVAGGWLSSPPGTQWRIIREMRAAGGGVSVIGLAPAGWFGKLKAAFPVAFGDVYSVSLADVPARKHWLRAMRDWKNLHTLWLNRSALADADLIPLSGHTVLTELYLNGNPITAAGLRNVGSKPRLRHLELNWTRVRNFESLQRQFPGLQVLKLRGTSFSDTDVKDLAGFSDLNSLDLSRTRITDAGLLELAKLPRFPLIDLRGTPTTYAGARRLHAAMPHSYVHASTGQIISPELQRSIPLRQRLWIAPKMFR